VTGFYKIRVYWNLPFKYKSVRLQWQRIWKSFDFT